MTDEKRPFTHRLPNLSYVRLFQSIIVLTIFLLGCNHKTAVLETSLTYADVNLEGGALTARLGNNLTEAGEIDEIDEIDEGLVEKILATAYSQMGKAYRYGGTSPKTGFDCAGYIQWVFGQHGIKTPRTSRSMLKAGTSVGKEDIRPGDIVVYYRNRARRTTHAGIYTGNGKFIHSPHTGDRVKESPAFDRYHQALFIQARRVIKDSQAAPLDEAAKRKALRNARAERSREKAKTTKSRKYKYYKVRPGDTLWKIARRHNVSIKKLRQINGLKSDKALRVAQKLKIPVAGGGSGSEQQEKFKKTAKASKYTVRKGDTISLIAVRHRVSTQNLLAANHLPQRHVLKIGQKLVIPGRGGRETIDKKAVLNASADGEHVERFSSGQNTVSGQPASPKYYVVKKGDTLSTIAYSHNISTKSLLRANGLTHKYVLRIGKKLVIPGQSSRNTTGREESIKQAADRETVVSLNSGGKPSHKQPRATLNYVVKKGDTLSGIARQTGVSITSLIEANRLGPGHRLKIGERLIVPVKKEAVRKANKQTLHQETRVANQAGINKTYKVRKGDSIWTIARRFGVSVNTLLQANDLSDNHMLKVGEQLTIP